MEPTADVFQTTCEIKALLAEAGMRANRNLGQWFLIDRRCMEMKCLLCSWTAPTVVRKPIAVTSCLQYTRKRSGGSTADRRSGR